VAEGALLPYLYDFYYEREVEVVPENLDASIVIPVGSD
jgi:hypothetical protein